MSKIKKIDMIDPEEGLEIKLDWIRCESARIWDYLQEAINWIENKYYLHQELDENELLVYCKSCEENNEVVEYLSYVLLDELNSEENIS